MTHFFHGTNRTGPYFEGWYFKHQNPQGQTLALIPAFHIGREGRRTASLQIVSKDQAWWLEYPASQLQISRRPFQVQIGQSSCLEAELLNERRQPLRAPVEGRMERTIHENLCAEVRYRFWHGDNLLFQHTDPNASFEYSSAD